MDERNLEELQNQEQISAISATPASRKSMQMQFFQSMISWPAFRRFFFLVQPFYRAYSSGAKDHFYTTDAAEYANAVANIGYSAEGIACRIFTTNVDGGGTVPIYRLYSHQWLDHFYTVDTAERDNAITKLGFALEGIVGYVYADNHCGGVPLYRLMSRIISIRHRLPNETTQSRIWDIRMKGLVHMLFLWRSYSNSTNCDLQ